MNSTRFLKLVIVPALIIAALIALQAFKSTAGARNGNHPYIGIGDLRHFEAQLSISDTGTQASNREYTGMGDLRRFEAQPSIPDTGVLNINHINVGMGDLRRFEAQK